MRCLLTKNIWWLNDPSILLAFWHPDKTFMGEWKVDRLSIESIIIASTNSSIPASITHNQQKNDDCDHTSFPDRIINKVILAHTSLPPPPPPPPLPHHRALIFSPSLFIPPSSLVNNCLGAQWLISTSLSVWLVVLLYFSFLPPHLSHGLNILRP